ncbi:SIS domain-containing protein [soil metagenome]
MDLRKYSKYLYSHLEKIDNTKVEELSELIFAAYKNEKMIFIIGNGGSAANASHFAQDLAKGTRFKNNQKKFIKALSLTDNLPFLSAVGNDDGYENVFSEQLKTFASSGDLVIAVSGSGNSPNIIKAIEWANTNDLTTIGITGYDGGKLAKINKFNLHTELNDMCTVESIHSIIFHYLIIDLKNKIEVDLSAQ